MHAVMSIQGSGPSKKFLGKIFAKSKILAGGLDLAIPWVRSWPRSLPA